MNVLIVEDDKTTRDIMSYQLQARGHVVTPCGSAEEAQQAIEGQAFDLALLDWMLPGQSGPEFCRWLRGRPEGKDVYVLLSTARAMPADLDEALNAGANDYLMKPWESAVFRARLRIAEQQVSSIQERRKSLMELDESNRRLERLALVARQTQNGVVILNATGAVEWANEAFAKMMRIDRESIPGRDFKTLLERVDLSHRSEMEAALEEGRASEGELAIGEAIGEKQWLHYSLNPLVPEKGLARGQVCLFSDITMVRKAAEERFKTGKIESLGILAGGIAHDLNNILTVISGNIALGRHSFESDPAKARDHLDKADKAALRAADLSKQLLTFAKGGDPLKQVFDLRELVEKATKFSLYGSNLTCLFTLPNDLWKVHADPYQIEQVINSIVINAREAMPNGGRLQVRAQNTSFPEFNPHDLPPGDYVRVTLVDNGPGIPPEVLPQIFDPYFTTKPTGSGLGLSIAFSILSKHGGRIQVEPVASGGARFVLLLPAAKTGAAREKAAEPVEVECAATTASQPTVLCMDDEPTIRDLTTAMLTMSGYGVVTTRDGQETLAIYREKMNQGRKFDVVVLDATIPGGMGGADTIRALLKIDPDVRAIICSGYSDESALAAMEKLGFQASLPKPFTSKQLITLIDQIVHQPV